MAILKPLAISMMFFLPCYLFGFAMLYEAQAMTGYQLKVIANSMELSPAQLSPHAEKTLA